MTVLSKEIQVQCSFPSVPICLNRFVTFLASFAKQGANLKKMARITYTIGKSYKIKNNLEF